MFIENILSELPMFLYLSVISASVVLAIIILVDLITFKIRALTTVSDLENVKTSVEPHRGCHIENLPLINDVFDDAPVNISQAFEKLIQTASDMYHKKWIPEPGSFICLHSVAEQGTIKRLSSPLHIYYSLIGFLLFTSTNIAGIVLLDSRESILSTFVFSLLPLLLSIFLVTVFHIERKKTKSQLDSAIDSLNRTLSLKLPVFNENNGMSILINQFLEYDRNMTKSVDTLTDKIDRFALEGLSTAISESVHKAFIESVAPSIERANDAVITLSEDIARRESEGMKELAVNFSSAVSNELSYHFGPIAKKMKDVGETLSQSKEYMDLVSQTLGKYKDNLVSLQETSASSLKDYEQARSSFSEDVKSISQSLSSFATTAKEYEDRTHQELGKIEKVTGDLYESSLESNKTLKTLLDGIFVEARNAEEMTEKAQKNTAAYLETMQKQIDELSEILSSHNRDFKNEMTEQSNKFFERYMEDMQNQQSVLSSRFETLLESIEESAQSMRKSSQQLKDGFDELEAARLREENKKKSSFFRRNK